MGDEDNKALKLQYAARLAYGMEEFEAALELFPDNTGYALWIANSWPKDIEVLTEVQRLRTENGGLDLLPNEAKVLKELWDRLHNSPTAKKDYIAGMKLYAEIRGYVKKTPDVVIDNTPKQKVIVLPAAPAKDEWEAKAVKQQKDLTDVATSRHK